jgi:tRNA U34 5-methylaminomethyl-2-thiouridine-forming methyltransferase MnmC
VYYLQTTRDGSDTLYSVEFQQTFHSIPGALTETEYVFVKGTGVADRLRQGQASRILEVGFGTGLNFLATAETNTAYLEKRPGPPGKREMLVAIKPQ